MSFKKYPSMENSYRQKYIDKVLNWNPDLRNIVYIAREKIDGANIQLYFTPNEPMRVGKRTGILEPGEKLFDIWGALERNKQDLDIFQNYCNTLEHPLIVYGELYGPGINNRVDYGLTAQTICVFDIRINGEFCSQLLLEVTLAGLGLTYLLPPMFGSFESLDAALQIDVEVPSKVFPKEGNITEGVIIQPYSPLDRSVERFVLKKKSSGFDDVRVEKIKSGMEPKIDSATQQLNEKFRSYITNNRLLDIFSKHGQIEEPKQISQYIKLTLEDAKSDFLKDEVIPEEVNEKDVYNVGSKIVMLLREHL